MLPQVDRIIVLEDGEVTHQGTYDEIMKENIRLKELIETHTKQDVDKPVGEEASRRGDGAVNSMYVYDFSVPTGLHIG